jgi:hypothetical protein
MQTYSRGLSLEMLGLEDPSIPTYDLLTVS